MKIISNGFELPLQLYANRLKEHRAEIVLIMKALEENQCQIEVVDSFQKMIQYVQTQNEGINTQLQTQSARVKLAENIAQVNKMNVTLINNSKLASAKPSKNSKNKV